MARSIFLDIDPCRHGFAVSLQRSKHIQTGWHYQFAPWLLIHTDRFLFPSLQELYLFEALQINAKAQIEIADVA
jgi:hypothetical protein